MKCKRIPWDMKPSIFSSGSMGEILLNVAYFCIKKQDQIHLSNTYLST